MINPPRGRGQGHATHFYILDLVNFATASRQYTGVINNSRRRSAYNGRARRS